MKLIQTMSVKSVETPVKHTKINFFHSGIHFLPQIKYSHRATFLIFGIPKYFEHPTHYFTSSDYDFGEWLIL